MVKMESIHSEGVPFGALNLPDIKNLKWGNPKPKQFLGFQKLISSILSGVELFAEFNGEIIFFNPTKRGGVTAWVQRCIQAYEKHCNAA